MPARGLSGWAVRQDPGHAHPAGLALRDRTRAHHRLHGVGTGVVIGGPGLAYLRQLDVRLLERGLTRAGWTCRDDVTVDCRTRAGGNRTLVWGTDQEIRVSAPTPQALAAATRVLALSPVVAEAAADCAPDTVCEHLVVDGFDMFFDVTDQVSRVRIKVRRDF